MKTAVTLPASVEMFTFSAAGVSVGISDILTANSADAVVRTYELTDGIKVTIRTPHDGRPREIAAIAGYEIALTFAPGQRSAVITLTPI